MVRPPFPSKEGLNHGAWTAMEDTILSEYIRIHGDGGWKNIAKSAGLKRCAKSCRLRWLNYLRPDIKRGNISPDEEDLIIRLHRLLGNRWSLIAGRLPGRTDNEIKNYWNTHLSKKLPLNEPQHKTSKNLSTSSESSFPVQNRVFKATAVKITTAVKHTEIKRPQGYNGNGCTNPITDEACRLYNVKETTKSEHSAHNLVQTETTNCSSTMSSLVDQQSPLSDHFRGDAATLAESLLYLNDLSSPDCNLLLSPSSDCSTDFATEEFYRRPVTLPETINGLEDNCCDQSNMQRVNSFTVADDQEMEEFYNSTQHVDWIHGLDYLENSSSQPLSFLLLESEDEWEERSTGKHGLEDNVQIP